MSGNGAPMGARFLMPTILVARGAKKIDVPVSIMLRGKPVAVRVVTSHPRGEVFQGILV